LKNKTARPTVSSLFIYMYIIISIFIYVHAICTLATFRSCHYFQKNCKSLIVQRNRISLWRRRLLGVVFEKTSLVSTLPVPPSFYLDSTRLEIKTFYVHLLYEIIEMFLYVTAGGGITNMFAHYFIRIFLLF